MTRRRSLPSLTSLTARLSIVLVAVTFAVAAATVVWSYRQALDVARNLQDDILTQVATIAASTTAAAGDGRPDLQPLTNRSADIDVAALPLPGIPASTPDGLRTVATVGEQLRVVVVHRSNGSALLVSQPVAVRDQIAQDSARATVLPLAILVPVLLLSIVLVIRRLLTPVNRLADQVRHRASTDLRPVDSEHAPTELRGFLDALNTQLSRVSAATDHERLFISQAAHELRTPLTAMSLQLERASRAVDLPTVHLRLRELDRGMRRSRHVVDQLLELAGARAENHGIAIEGADRARRQPAVATLGSMLREVVGELLPIADAAGVEVEVQLELARPDTLILPVAATVSILRNLLDNAIRYSPRGGLVVLAVARTENHLVVTIDDAGPGISDPARVIEPFFRETGQNVSGSGLGLAVVVAQLHRLGGKLMLIPTPHTLQGTRAQVEIPLESMRVTGMNGAAAG